MCDNVGFMHQTDGVTGEKQLYAADTAGLESVWLKKYTDNWKILSFFQPATQHTSMKNNVLFSAHHADHIMSMISSEILFCWLQCCIGWIHQLISRQYVSHLLPPIPSSLEGLKVQWAATLKDSQSIGMSLLNRPCLFFIIFIFCK